MFSALSIKKSFIIKDTFCINNGYFFIIADFLAKIPNFICFFSSIILKNQVIYHFLGNKYRETMKTSLLCNQLI